MGCQSVLVVRWSVARDFNPGRRSTGGRRRRKVGAPSRTAACCPPSTGNENWARGVTGFFPAYTRIAGNATCLRFVRSVTMETALEQALFLAQRNARVGLGVCQSNYTL